MLACVRLDPNGEVLVITCRLAPVSAVESVTVRAARRIDRVTDRSPPATKFGVHRPLGNMFGAAVDDDGYIGSRL